MAQAQDILTVVARCRAAGCRVMSLVTMPLAEAREGKGFPLKCETCLTGTVLPLRDGELDTDIAASFEATQLLSRARPEA